MSFLWTAAANSFLSTLRLWVALPAAHVCSAGQISRAMFCEYIALIRNQNFFQLCLFLSLSALSPSIYHTPTSKTYCLFFLRLTQSENAIAFHSMRLTRPLKVMFSTPLPHVFPVSRFEMCQGINLSCIHLFQKFWGLGCTVNTCPK